MMGPTCHQGLSNVDKSYNTPRSPESARPVSPTPVMNPWSTQTTYAHKVTLLSSPPPSAHSALPLAFIHPSLFVFSYFTFIRHSIKLSLSFSASWPWLCRSLSVPSVPIIVTGYFVPVCCCCFISMYTTTKRTSLMLCYRCIVCAFHCVFLHHRKTGKGRNRYTLTKILNIFTINSKKSTQMCNLWKQLKTTYTGSLALTPSQCPCAS